jgi:glycosyltransferase involved in cell wall biosynthesis
MGAPWVHDDYYDAIEAAKATHGVRYFQIFHDLIPTLMPELVSIGLIGGFTKSIAGMLDCADHILANSRWSETDLRTTCAAIGARCPPTSVVRLGGAIDYRQDNAAPTPIRPSKRPSPREIHGDYVLCVGTIEPRKNHVYLYNVWKRMLRELGAGVPKIVCIGRMGWHVEDLKRYLEVSDNLDDHFVHLSDVGDDELKRYYRDCLFTVFPSLYEGWGLPVAESLSHGKLCVSSNATSMPEVGGDWVVYIDPHNVNDGFQVISSLIRDPARVRAWERRLCAQYEPLSWRDATIGLMGTIEAAIRALPAIATNAETRPHEARRKRIDEGAAYAFSCLSPKGGPVGLLRAEVRARAVRALLDGLDWHPTEDWGCWSCGPVARVSFLPPESADTRLVCYVTVRLPPPAVEQRIHVFVDQVSRGRIRLSGAADRQIRIDIACAASPDCGSRPILIELHLETVSHPPPDSADQRLLGLGLSSLCVVGIDALNKRIAFLERDALKVPDAAPEMRPPDAAVTKLKRRTQPRRRDLPNDCVRRQNPNM